jgi:hypothetical protein
MVEKFNPAPLDKHPEDPKEAAKADREMDGRFGWHISGVRPGQRHAARDATRLAKSIVDSLMGQNPDRAPTRQKNREGPIVASGRGDVSLAGSRRRALLSHRYGPSPRGGGQRTG